MLQCGHDVTVVENVTEESCEESWSGLQCGHDVPVGEKPRLRGRAGGPGPACIGARRHRRGEHQPTTVMTTGPFRLQCGHDVTVVENQPDGRGVRAEHGFNAATTSPSWRTTSLAGGEPRGEAASMRPRRHRRGEPLD